jgi:hypothetical protein
MSQQELLRKVVELLNRIGVPYMLTGSLASSLHGEPRSTHDIDLVIAIEPAVVPLLVEAFPLPDYYLDQDAILRAIETKSMFNLIDAREGGKVDFWLLTDDAFDRSRFSRRQTESFLGLQIDVSSPEDTILAKLNWARLSGGSEKQFTDALRVFEVQFQQLDLAYLEQWVEKMGVRPLWVRIKDEAEPL